MHKTFGSFIEDFPPDRDSLELSFTPTSERIRHRWRSQRLSSHFVADYFINFLPLDEGDPEAEKRIKETKGAISYVTNELLENAMKFNLTGSDHRFKSKVKFGIHFLDETEIVAVMFASNNVSRAGAEKFQMFIRKLLSADPEEMYMQQVEASAEDENAEISGLGFLTMLNDYQAKLGWQFTPLTSRDDFFLVTTMAQIRV
ncbi:hypothetical protein S7335_500 [Synechococcus sp. PCC 7335]|uniref:DUF6272 family protein n=1 Tax=Synechococcus sp. (strain ATCC 29403 / PCC 7335) TaxID=91464 RepID=UPI00017ECB70|nr:DUF6272 family protein [Synechococcus sp. PCC 7335]EDX83320.1 hypothetical protein S7335_500 [Synechococcus sp. PCC 7335]